MEYNLDTKADTFFVFFVLELDFPLFGVVVDALESIFGFELGICICICMAVVEVVGVGRDPPLALTVIGALIFIFMFMGTFILILFILPILVLLCMERSGCCESAYVCGCGYGCA